MDNDSDNSNNINTTSGIVEQLTTCWIGSRSTCRLEQTIKDMDIESSCSNLLHVEEISRNVCRFERPNDVFALKHCGEAYLMLDIYQEALADLNKPLKIWPNDTWTLSRRVTTYCMLKKYQETFTDLNKSLEIRLNDVFALKHRGKYQEALADLNKSLEIQPNDAFALKQ